MTKTEIEIGLGVLLGIMSLWFFYQSGFEDN